jgi:hypothetical protein
MTKFFSGLVVALLLTLNLPNSSAEENPVTVSLISQSRVWLDDRANISFTIEDFSGGGISNAEFEISKSALLGRSAIRSIISKPNSVEYSQIFETTNVLQNENQFRVTLPGTRLKFDGAGTYALRITVYVRGESKKLTSFVSFLPKSLSIQNLNVSTVLPLVVNAGLTPTDSVLNDKAANSFLDQSSLNSVLDIGKSISNVTWLLDADTLRLAQSISDNRTIAQPENQDLSEEQVSGAQSWLEKVSAQLNYSNTYAIPTGNINTLALKATGLNRIAKLAVSDAQYVTDYFAAFRFKTITVAPEGDYSNSDFEWLKNQNLSFNILNSKSYPATNSIATPNGIVNDGNGTKAPVIDQYSSKLFSDAISSDVNSGTYQAAFAGDLLITALEQPGVSRYVVLKPETNLEGITNSKFSNAIKALSAPWISGERLANFRDYSVGDRSREQITNQLSKNSNSVIKLARETKRNLASLISDAEEESQIDFTILRLANVSADKKTLSQLQDQSRSFLDGLNNAVRIMSTGSVIFPNEFAKVPITVRNDLSVPIQIGIITSGIPAVRVIPESIADMQIAPGRRKSIEIPTRLIGTDTAYLQLQIVDLNGKRIGSPIAIEVSSSAYAQAAAWVIGAAFALLMLFAIRNTVKRIRSSRDNSQENMEL